MQNCDFRLQRLLAELSNDACRDMKQGKAGAMELELEHTFATICSGTEITTVALQALQKAMPAHGFRHRFRCLWTCEIDKSKWDWQRHLFKHYDEDSCMFENAVHLHKPMQKCLRHGEQCRVMSPEGVVAGVSCKDFSKQNPKRFLNKASTGGGPSVLASSSSPGGSAQTTYALMRIIEVYSPLWVVLENSDELLEDNPDWTIILSFFQESGYRCVPCILDTQEFGLPARRRRGYLTAILTASRKHSLSNEAFEEFQKEFFIPNLNAMRRIPPSVVDVLERPDSKIVEKAQQDWLDHKAAALEPGTVDGHMSLMRSSHSPAVTSYSRIQCRDSSRASDWFPAMNARMKPILSQRQEAHRNIADFQIYDLSQSGHRIPCSSPHGEFPEVLIATTVLPGSFFWIRFPDPGAGTAGAQLHPSMTQERPLVSEEHLLLQGWPIRGGPVPLHEIPRNVQTSLAGNMFSASVILSVIASLIFSVPWADPDDSDFVEESEQCADLAFDAVASL